MEMMILLLVWLKDFHISQPDGADDEATVSELFRQNIVQFADVEMETELPIVLFTWVPGQTPHGRITRSSTNLLQDYSYFHTNNRQIYFVMHINLPIHQGQTRYSSLVFGSVKDEKAEIELNLTKEQLKNQYNNRIEKNLVEYSSEIEPKLLLNATNLFRFGS